MKKIIRLTENDLARIVRRKLSEAVSGSGTYEDPYLMKVFQSEIDKEDNTRSHNINVYDLSVKDEDVEFFYFFAGKNKLESGSFHCDRNYVTLFSQQYFLTDEASAIFQKKCDAYASTGSKQSNMTESRRYKRRF